jgi:hypothetical protein
MRIGNPYWPMRPGSRWVLRRAASLSTEGSFEARVDGAQAGVIMPAKPKVGLRYRQEYYKGHAEDRAQVLSTKEEVEVPFGHFRRGRVLMTRDLNPLEPKVLEYKFYARRIGPVLGWVFPAEATARSS